MIPHIFVSSTIADLHHLRDAIRDTLVELAYSPVMSEYGDIGYLPSATAEDSCYLMLEHCQLALIVIGKRYGSLGRGGLSVTHNEFRTARERKTPVITLVDSEVLAFKRVYDVTKDQSVFAAPGMDSPQATFGFLDDVTNSEVNNGVLGFSTVSDARQHLKRQLAHIFGEMLRNQFDPVRAELKDILSELKTLRHEFRSPGTAPDDKFLRAMRFMVDDSRRAHYYRQWLNMLEKPVDQSIPTMLNAVTFDELVKTLTGREPKVIGDDLESWPDILKDAKAQGLAHWRRFLVASPDAQEQQRYALIGVGITGEALVNTPGLQYLRRAHEAFRKFVERPAAV